MFSVVGLLGMTGIIINDSIVLVTTIDEYAKDRGLIPSIIDGVVDRLRPVLLTTLTTVLGLMPLLFERSQQAQFLKPTVITLVYGLGFGLLLVLLVVPALVAMQHDVNRQIEAFRRGLRLRRARGVRVGFCLGMVAILAWFVLTMGVTMMTGSLPPQLVQALPVLAHGPALLMSLAVYAVGAVALILLLYLALALGQMLRARRDVRVHTL